MQSLWLENQSLSLPDIPKPHIPGEALIRVRLSGICGPDLELLRGYYSLTGVLGHEFVGEVVSVNESDEFLRRKIQNEQTLDPDKQIGKRVVGEINVACSMCEHYQHGRPTHCEQRSVLGIANRDGVRAGFTTFTLANALSAMAAAQKPGKLMVLLKP